MKKPLNEIFGTTTKPSLDDIFSGTTEKTPGFGERVVSDVKQRISNIKDISTKTGKTKFEGGDGSGISAPSAGLQTARQVTAIASDVVGEGIKSIIGKKGEQAISKVVSPIAKTVSESESADKYRAWKDKNPEAAGNLESILGLAGDVATIVPLAKGAQVAKAGIKEAGKVVSSNVKSGIETATNKIASMSENASPQIMNKVARLTPTQANKFKQIAGMTHGEYLAKTGNFANPEKIITNEATKFAQSVKAVDETLASLPGKYKNGAINDALDSLVKKALSVSTDSVKSPYLKEATSLLNKAKKEGLTMGEMNQAKRLFEKNVKLGYNKMLNPKEVELATNIDNAVREFQFKTAKRLGFKNLDEMNKQTQISKEIVNSLGKQLTGKTGLNEVSLTDWIMLSGGDPAAVGGLLTKKLFGNKSVQARIAKILSNEKAISEIKPVIK